MTLAFFKPNEYDVESLNRDTALEDLERTQVYLTCTKLFNAEKLEDYQELEKMCEGFEEWDARFCAMSFFPVGFMSLPYPKFYIINTDDEYGYDTNMFLTKSALVTSSEDDQKRGYNSIRKSSCEMEFPRKYHDFERFKMWFIDTFPDDFDLRLLVDKIITREPAEVPCLVSYCFIEGVIDSFIVRNKKYTLAETIRFMLDEFGKDPPPHKGYNFIHMMN